jgi:hypothetical protein
MKKAGQELLQDQKQILPNPPFSKEGTILATPKSKSSSLFEREVGRDLLLMLSELFLIEIRVVS